LNLHHWQFYGPNELEPACLAAFLAILLFGPGKYSLDAQISKK
jgi:putative oxidoreductase